MHSAVAPSQGSEASTSFSTITMSEVLRDLETSSKRRISDKHAAKLFEQWFRDLSVDKKFQSSSNFAEVKLKELTRSGPTANGNADFSTAEEANTETLRIAFAFELLDKLSNSRNSAAPLLRMVAAPSTCCSLSLSADPERAVEGGVLGDRGRGPGGPEAQLSLGQDSLVC